MKFFLKNRKNKKLDFLIKSKINRNKIVFLLNNWMIKKNLEF